MFIFLLSVKIFDAVFKISLPQGKLRHLRVYRRPFQRPATPANRQTEQLTFVKIDVKVK
jgi:hypothetical protein